jgi:hypothetical protein
LTGFSEDLFVDVAKHRGLVGFGLEWCWIRDTGNLAYSKHEGVSDFFSEGGSVGFRGVCWFVLNVRWVSRVMGWPHANTNVFLITSRDLKFRVSNKGVEGFVPPDEEPRVVDEFEGEVSLGCGVNAIGGFLRLLVVLPEGFT